jgi:hypothetical protein
LHQGRVHISFNGKFRDECLSVKWFRNRTDAKIIIEQFRHEFTDIRSQSSFGTHASQVQTAIVINNPELAIMLSSKWTKENR